MFWFGKIGFCGACCDKDASALLELDVYVRLLLLQNAIIYCMSSFPGCDIQKEVLISFFLDLRVRYLFMFLQVWMK